MARHDPTLIYVHGAGAQPPETDWVRLHNQILFSDGHPPSAEVAYYADLVDRHDDPAAAAMTTGNASSPAMAGTMERASSPGTMDATDLSKPIDEGDSIIHDSVAREGRTREAHVFLLRLAAAMGPTDHRSRFALPGHVIPPAVGNFFREVSGYLHGASGMADSMRERVRTAIIGNDGPLVVLAHSLGSIIAFDVLSEPGMAGRDVTFITVGSPLGLGPAQDHLRVWRGSRPIEIPAGVSTWRNFHAAGDPVAAGSGLEGLRNDYSPSLRVHSTQVRNEAEWHHALNGYLEAPEVRDAVHARLRSRSPRRTA